MSRIFPIGGGKGGVGKSFITANLGALFAKQGKKVVLVDLDLGGSNLHSFLGLRNPRPGLNDFLNRKVTRLDQVAEPTAMTNLHLISTANCSIEIANLYHAQKVKIIRAIIRLPYDYILMDLGPGTGFNTLDFLLTSREGLIISTPEPTSVENTIRFIKAAYYRKLKRVIKRHAFTRLVKEASDNSKDPTVKSPSDIINTLMKYDPEKGKLLQNILGELRFKFILNQFRKQIDVNLGHKIEKVCDKHFCSKFQFIGNIRYDEKVHDSLFYKNIYVDKYPYSSTAVDLRNIVKKIIGNGRDSVFVSQNRMKGVEEQKTSTHHYQMDRRSHQTNAGAMEKAPFGP